MSNYSKKMKHLNVLWVFKNVLFTHLLNSRAPGSLKVISDGRNSVIYNNSHHSLLHFKSIGLSGGQGTRSVKEVRHEQAKFPILNFSLTLHTEFYNVEKQSLV